MSRARSVPPFASTPRRPMDRPRPRPDVRERASDEITQPDQTAPEHATNCSSHRRVAALDHIEREDCPVQLIAQLMREKTQAFVHCVSAILGNAPVTLPPELGNGVGYGIVERCGRRPFGNLGLATLHQFVVIR